MSISIAWTKSWSASDNGTILYGSDLGNIQSDIATAFGTAATLTGTNTWSGANTFSGTTTISGTTTLSGTTALSGTTTSKIPIQGLFKNLLIVRTSASVCTITADMLTVADTSFNCFTINTVSQTATITNSGAGGLDTGVEASTTWYYMWIIRKSTDGTVSALLSTSSTAPTMPSGYDQKALVGAVHNDGSSNFIDFRQVGRIYTYNVWRTITSGNIGTGSWNSVTMTTFVPSGLSNYCFGTIKTGGSLGAITNDSTVATGGTDAANKYGGGAADFERWELDMITANTLYAIGDNANFIMRIHGFHINKLG